MDELPLLITRTSMSTLKPQIMRRVSSVIVPVRAMHGCLRSRLLAFQSAGVFAEGGCAVALGPVIERLLSGFQVLLLATSSAARMPLPSAISSLAVCSSSCRPIMGVSPNFWVPCSQRFIFFPDPVRPLSDGFIQRLSKGKEIYAILRAVTMVFVQTIHPL